MEEGKCPGSIRVYDLPGSRLLSLCLSRYSARATIIESITRYRLRRISPYSCNPVGAQRVGMYSMRAKCKNIHADFFFFLYTLPCPVLLPIQMQLKAKKKAFSLLATRDSVVRDSAIS